METAHKNDRQMGKEGKEPTQKDNKSDTSEVMKTANQATMRFDILPTVKETG